MMKRDFLTIIKKKIKQNFFGKCRKKIENFFLEKISKSRRTPIPFLWLNFLRG